MPNPVALASAPRDPRIPVAPGGRRFLGGLLAAAIALAGPQVACNNGSPTAPPPPPINQDPLQPVVVSANYVLLVEPVNEDRDYPRGGEVIVDGRTVWSGPVQEPAVGGGSYWSYYYGPPANIGARVTEELAASVHTIAFRVTDQRRSPTGYNVSGWVDVDWEYFRGGVRIGNRTTRRVASWSATQVRLRTGESWTAEFIVPEAPR